MIKNGWLCAEKVSRVVLIFTKLIPVGICRKVLRGRWEEALFTEIIFRPYVDWSTSFAQRPIKQFVALRWEWRTIRWKLICLKDRKPSRVWTTRRKERAGRRGRRKGSGINEKDDVALMRETKEKRTRWHSIQLDSFYFVCTQATSSAPKPWHERDTSVFRDSRRCKSCFETAGEQRWKAVTLFNSSAKLT